jgi:hypothetical protein
MLLRDLQAFLASDAQELPQSFKQLLRLAESRVSDACSLHCVSKLLVLLSLHDK